MINKAAMELYENQEIRIVTPKGKPKRRNVHINNDDIIKREPQLLLFSPK